MLTRHQSLLHYACSWSKVSVSHQGTGATSLPHICSAPWWESWYRTPSPPEAPASPPTLHPVASKMLSTSMPNGTSVMPFWRMISRTASPLHARSSEVQVNHAGVQHGDIKQTLTELCRTCLGTCAELPEPCASRKLSGQKMQGEQVCRGATIGKHLQVELPKAGPVAGSGKGMAAAQQRARRVRLKCKGARADALEEAVCGKAPVGRIAGEGTPAENSTTPSSS